VESFARDNWWHCGAAIAKGKLYSELGRYAEAEKAFRHASWLDLGAVEGLNLITLLNLRQNHLDAAVAAQRRAISRQPDQPRQYLMLSDILEKMGRHDEAQAALAQVHHLQTLVKPETTVDLVLN
jgi:tetratricopeptide (TPR) repeat protein